MAGDCGACIARSVWRVMRPRVGRSRVVRRRVGDGGRVRTINLNKDEEGVDRRGGAPLVLHPEVRRCVRVRSEGVVRAVALGASGARGEPEAAGERLGHARGVGLGGRGYVEGVVRWSDCEPELGFPQCEGDVKGDCTARGLEDRHNEQSAGQGNQLGNQLGNQRGNQRGNQLGNPNLASPGLETQLLT